MAAVENTTVAMTASSDAPSDTETTRSSDWYLAHSKDTFQAMNLPRNLLKGIYSYGFDTPSQV